MWGAGFSRTFYRANLLIYKLTTEAVAPTWVAEGLAAEAGVDTAEVGMRICRFVWIGRARPMDLTGG